MNTRLQELTNELTTTIVQLTQRITEYEKYILEINSNTKEQENDEIKYNTLKEKQQKAISVLECEETIKQMIEEYQCRTEIYFMECQEQKKQIEIDLQQIEKIENSEISDKSKKHKYHHKSTKTKTEKERIKKEKKQLSERLFAKRMENVKEYLSQEELKSLENDSGKYIGKVLFDSTKDDWNIESSIFFESLEFENMFVIVIQTTEGSKFGCWISKMINQRGKYISDPNSFLFKFNNDQIEKYFPIDKLNVLKIGCSRDDELFCIGKGDVVIKKYHQKDKCSCKQTSFHYEKKQNALIGRKGTFEIEKFIVYKMISKNERTYNLTYNLLKILEEWTSKTFEITIFDTEIDDWKDPVVLNQTLIGKKHLLFLIEDDRGEKFCYYLDSKVRNLVDQQVETNEKSFHFNVKSNGRLLEPMKFEFNEGQNCGYRMFGKSEFNDNLLRIGDILLRVEHKKHQSYCSETKQIFNYHGISNALCGKVSGSSNQFFTLKRFIIFQMK